MVLLSALAVVLGGCAKAPGADGPRDRSFGPLVFGGLYCWEEVGDTIQRHGRFGLYNPTDLPIKIWVSGEAGIVNSKQEWVSDGNYRGLGGLCKYRLQIRRADSENQHLADDYEHEFKGRDLAPALSEAVSLVKQFFLDLNDRDIDSIRSYTEPRATADDVATLVSWRAGNEPVSTRLVKCDDPRFRPDTSTHLLVTTARRCEMEITYAVYGHTKSGRWIIAVNFDLRIGAPDPFAGEAMISKRQFDMVRWPTPATRATRAPITSRPQQLR